jgi:hypothetical protein|tara:strand:- start:125 stop:664 length:540 start_codon:yes stop_codon:yes gene_type:complete
LKWFSHKNTNFSLKDHTVPGFSFWFLIQQLQNNSSRHQNWHNGCTRKRNFDKEESMHRLVVSKQPEDPDRRKNKRSIAPMTVVIGNTPYAIGNWSCGGIKISNYYGVLQPTHKAKLRVLVPLAGPGAIFHAYGEVKRYEPDDLSLSMSFENLDRLASGTLNRYFLEQTAYNTTKMNELY